ncbi:hypothetical protein B0H11DRAFT_1907501 [Mycena galericulata]|nr:hypothetical protein B0H11DRAFT_1907501 [Mycena galericulata]
MCAAGRIAWQEEKDCGHAVAESHRVAFQNSGDVSQVGVSITSIVSLEQQPTDKQIEDEMCLLDLEDADSVLEHVQDLVSQCFDDFPDDQIDDEALPDTPPK